MNQFIIFLLRPGLGKSTIIPYFVELMKSKLKEEAKILIIVPEAFLSGSLHSKMTMMDSTYNLAHDQIDNLDTLGKVTITSVDKLSSILICRGFKGCGIILDEVHTFTDAPMRSVKYRGKE